MKVLLSRAAIGGGSGGLRRPFRRRGGALQPLAGREAGPRAASTGKANQTDPVVALGQGSEQAGPNRLC